MRISLVDRESYTANMMLLSELKEVLWQSPRQVLGSDEQCLRCSATIDSTARTVARTLGDRRVLGLKLLDDS